MNGFPTLRCRAAYSGMWRCRRQGCLHQWVVTDYDPEPAETTFKMGIPGMVDPVLFHAPCPRCGGITYRADKTRIPGSIEPSDLELLLIVAAPSACVVNP